MPLEERVHPIPFRTRQLSSPSSMILHILMWESRTVPRLYFEAHQSGGLLFLPFLPSSISHPLPLIPEPFPSPLPTPVSTSLQRVISSLLICLLLFHGIVQVALPLFALSASPLPEAPRIRYPGRGHWNWYSLIYLPSFTKARRGYDAKV